VVVRAPITTDEIWRILERVPDPEVPAISVVDLGIVRDVRIDAGGATTVDVTPTYSGCPAMLEIERAIVGTLASHGVPNVEVRTVFTPAWTTDWMSDAAREKLRAYGIAPPERTNELALVPLMRRGGVETLACPFCGSRATETRSHFGSTACKSLHFCTSCHQPFEHFKAI
jgi:ring-1,2-phenylacetyl-CoA epoxidase subunit PaaD